MFKDRIDAGLALAQKLKKYQHVDGIVLAVPKGGVPIGYIVARELGLPMELILSKKIGHPLQKEYAIGAVSLQGSFIVPHEDVSQAYIERETKRIQAGLREMQKKFQADAEPQNLKDKIVIVVDDGIATGNTLLSTVNIIKKQEPAKIIIAVPVTSKQAYTNLSKYVDELIYLKIPDYFAGVGAFYEEFYDVSEAEVKQYLDALKIQKHTTSATTAM